MIKHNYIAGAPFIIPNKNGDLMMYTGEGEPIELYAQKVRVIQEVLTVDKYFIQGVCNVVASVVEMEEIIANKNKDGR